MSPAPVAAMTPPAAAMRPAAPTPPAAPAAPAPTASAAAPSPVPAGQPAPSTPGAKITLPKEVIGLVETTKGLDGVWATSAQQARAAVAALGKDAQLPDDAKSSVARLAFIGTVLGTDIPKDAKPVTLEPGADPIKAILGAEEAFRSAIGVAAKQSVDVMKTMPTDAPKEASAVVAAAQERIMDAMYAVKFSLRIAPPPAPKEAPAGQAPAAPGSAPAPGAPSPGAVPAPKASTPAPNPPAPGTPPAAPSATPPAAPALSR